MEDLLQADVEVSLMKLSANKIGTPEVREQELPDSSNDMLKELRDYHKYRHGLVVLDGVVTYKWRVVIPEKLRARVLETLHAAVSGMINGTERFLAEHNHRYIMRKWKQCAGPVTCVRNSPSQPAGKPHHPPCTLSRC